MIKINMPDFSLVFNIKDIMDYREDLRLFPGGIYFLVDEFEDYLYIGKSKNLYNRLLQHRRGRFSGKVSVIKVIFEDNPSYRDILETYAIMTFNPLYNLDKVYEDNRGGVVRDELSVLYFDKEELEISLYELKDLRNDLIIKITPPTVSGTYGHFGEDTDTDSRRYKDSLTALQMFRISYDIDDEYELHDVEKEIEAVESELVSIKDKIADLLEGLRV